MSLNQLNSLIDVNLVPIFSIPIAFVAVQFLMSDYLVTVSPEDSFFSYEFPKTYIVIIRGISIFSEINQEIMVLYICTIIDQGQQTTFAMSHVVKILIQKLAITKLELNSAAQSLTINSAFQQLLHS